MSLSEACSAGEDSAWLPDDTLFPASADEDDLRDKSSGDGTDATTSLECGLQAEASTESL